MMGLIWGYGFQGNGSGRRFTAADGDGIVSDMSAQGPVWLHLDRTQPATRLWMEAQADIPPTIREALLEEDTRPRCVISEHGVMLILRGINFDLGRLDEVTIAVRIWATPERVLVLTRYKVLAVHDMAAALDEGKGPHTIAEFLVRLIERLTYRIAPEIDLMEEALDVVEEQALIATTTDERRELARIRRRSLVLHRYLHPQREALHVFREGGGGVLPALDPHALGETAERVTRLVEDLETLRSRAQIVEDGIGIRVAERMNRNMYWLSIVATVFMPISFVTGLLGVNLGGIPGGDDGDGFIVLCVILFLLVSLELWLMRRMRLM
jgi:zinc transporter